MTVANLSEPVPGHVACLVRGQFSHATKGHALLGDLPTAPIWAVFEDVGCYTGRHDANAEAL